MSIRPDPPLRGPFRIVERDLSGALNFAASVDTLAADARSAALRAVHQRGVLARASPDFVN